MTSLTAGSQILFNRGDTFNGMIMATKSGTAGNEIVFEVTEPQSAHCHRHQGRF
ncbi:MAG: hypothetical protein IPG02_16400 [Ignavibacteria bacterium]|nr:hypothetical protein [Ignavibacteria bacterium]